MTRFHRSTRTTRRLVAWGLSLATCALAFAAPARGADPPTGTIIPVILNIYPNSGTTEAEARAAIEEANKLLAQAGVKLAVVEVNDPPGAGNGDANGDGDLTFKEGDDAQEFGGRELDGLPGKKGLKISFVKTPWVGRAIRGFSLHRNPTIIVKGRGNAADTGQTVAHEVGHVLTLGPRHKIDNDTNADGDGHAPNQPGDDGNDNLMAQGNRRTGTKLTQDQIDEIKRRCRHHGYCPVQFGARFPAVKSKLGYGRGTSPRRRGSEGERLRNASAAPDDLTRVVLTTAAGEPTVEAEVTIAGVLPAKEGRFRAQYVLAFDTDANPETGVVYGGTPGIDRRVRIRVRKSRRGALRLQGVVEDAVGGGRTPLPQAPVAVTDHRFADDGGLPGDTTFLVSLPKRLLCLSAPEVPVVAGAGRGAQPSETVTLVFDREAWQKEASLLTFGTGTPTPGEDYPVVVRGLTPETPFLLSVDDLPVLEGATDAGGSFVGEFPFPDLPTDQVHFLSAVDDEGVFAFNITCPVREVEPLP